MRRSFTSSCAAVLATVLALGSALADGSVRDVQLTVRDPDGNVSITAFT